MVKFKAGLKWFFQSFIWLGVLLLIIDIVSKNVIVWANNQGFIPKDGVVLIPNFLRISYVINTHVAFGKGFDNLVVNRVVFIIVALLVSIGIVLYLIKNWKTTRRLSKAIAFMIMAGALGNCIDRMFFTAEYLGVTYPGVVDWIDFYGVWQFTFNIADCCVVIAAFMLVIALIVDVIKEKINAPKVEKQPVEKVMSKTEIETQELREQSKDKDE